MTPQKKSNQLKAILMAPKKKPNQLNIATRSLKPELFSPSKSKIQSIILLDTETQHESEDDNEPSPNNLYKTENNKCFTI
jgi:hypothetical protein